MRNHFTRKTVSLALAGLVAAIAPSSGALAGPQPAAPELKPIPNEKLPIEPSLSLGELNNGLSWIIQPTDDPAAGASISFVIDAGSVHEPDGTVGAALLASRLVFSNSGSFAPGELEAALRQRGISVNRLQTVWHAFDSTVFHIDLPNADEGSLELALRMFADLPGGLVFDEQTVERERAFAMRDERVRQGIYQRLNDSVLPRLFPGTAFAEHPPAGDRDGIANLKAADLREFVETQYTPDRMTVVVAGPFEPMLVEHAIEHAFEHIKPADNPGIPEVLALDGGCARTQIVLTDPELSYGVVQLFVLLDVPSGEHTTSDLARTLSAEIGLEALRQRLESRRCDGVPVDQLRTITAGFSKEFLTTTIASIGSHELWREMLVAMTHEIATARQDGFTKREIESARRSVLTSYDRRTLNSLGDQPSEIARRLGTTRTMGGAPVSPAQRAESARDLLPLLTATRINRAFHKIYDPACIAAFVLLPESGDAPEERDVEKIFLDALKIDPDSNKRRALDAPRFARLPDQPGAIDALSVHPGERIVSATLANNIRVHHKRMPEMNGMVSVAITIAGGKIDEDERTRGLTEAGSSFWSAPATAEMTSCDFRSAMKANSIELRHEVGPDAVTVVLTGPADRAEAIFSAISESMSSPVLEPQTFDYWRGATLSRTAYIHSQPKQMLNEAIVDSIFPLDDPRHRSLTAEEIEKIEFGRARDWLGSLVMVSPIEASVVGDISKADALELAARSLGLLASRAPVGERANTDDRLLVPRDHPVAIDLAVRSLAPNSVTLIGFRGPGTGETEARINLDAAMRILGARLDRGLKGEGSGVATVNANSFANDAYPDFGLAYAYAETEPANAAEATQGIEHHCAELAYKGPTEEEVSLARLGALNDLKRHHNDPSWWSKKLSTMTYRGLTPDSFANDYDAVNAIDAQSVQQTLEFYHDSSRKVVITIRSMSPGHTDK